MFLLYLFINSYKYPFKICLKIRFLSRGNTTVKRDLLASLYEFGYTRSYTIFRTQGPVEFRCIIFMLQY